MLDHPILVMLGFMILWLIIFGVIPFAIWSFIEVFILGK